jgi:molybdenum cofactor biosynthesis enzyme MoaA
MSDCKPSGKHMTMDKFIDAMEFQIQYGGITCMITGGEPTEHPEFIEMVQLCCSMMKQRYGNRSSSVTVTTNGLWLCDNAPFVKMMKTKFPNCIFQVVKDDRYYPVSVDEKNNVFTYSNVMLCHDVANIYP